MQRKADSLLTVDEYIANVPAAALPSFTTLRKIVKAQAPDAKEVVSYGILGYKVDEKRARVFISGWKDHVAIYPVPKDDKLRDELQPYIKGKGTLWFRIDQPLPEDLIKRSVIALLKA
jgi:uncharacterized protein YdhG (YjbR/CyaY superfamily)